jgi:Domain of unknown function (DUF1707)
MTGPGDENAAAAAPGCGHMRASQADREHALDVLKVAFAEGRVTPDELDQRVGQVLAAQTYAELAVVTADIPAGLTAAPPAAAPPLPEPARVRRRRRVNKAAVWAVSGLIPPALMFAALFPDNSVAWGTLGPLAFIAFIGWLGAGVTMLARWHLRLAEMTAGQDGTRPERKPARLRRWAAKAAGGFLYGVVMPAAFTLAIAPGHTTVRVMVTTAAVITALFWGAGATGILAARAGRKDPAARPSPGSN